MKCLKRNKSMFLYMPRLSDETDLNDEGEHTGDFKAEYGASVLYYGNISAPSGHANQLFYGMDLRYTHILVMDNIYTSIQENGRIWWNWEYYEVIAVRRTLNAVSIALRKMTPEEAEEEPDEPDEPDEPEEPEEPEEPIEPIEPGEGGEPEEPGEGGEGEGEPDGGEEE